MLSELLSCHAGCTVEHLLQNGFPTVFCEVMGTGRWDRRVHDDFFRGTNPYQFWVQRSAQAESLLYCKFSFKKSVSIHQLMVPITLRYFVILFRKAFLLCGYKL